MQVVTLVDRQLRNAPFWGQVLTRLVKEHHFVLRLIDLTPSTPGDLTFPQLNLSAIFITNHELDNGQMSRVRALVTKQRSVALVVKCTDDPRAWERVQLQFVMADVPVIVVPALSSQGAAKSMARMAETTFSNVHDDVPDMRTAAELLRYLNLDDAQLQYVFERTTCLSDLATIISRPDERDRWTQELSEPIVKAIESLLLPDTLDTSR